MTAKEIFFDFCKENDIFRIVQLRMLHYSNSNRINDLGFLSENSFNQLLFLDNWHNIFSLKLGCLFLEQNINKDWRLILNRWKYFQKNNIFLKKQILKDGDIVECKSFNGIKSVGKIYGYNLYEPHTFICDYRKCNIGEIISVNWKKVPLDNYYIKQRGKIYGL